MEKYFLNQHDANKTNGIADVLINTSYQNICVLPRI